MQESLPRSQWQTNRRECDTAELFKFTFLVRDKMGGIWVLHWVGAILHNNVVHTYTCSSHVTKCLALPTAGESKPYLQEYSDFSLHGTRL